MIPPLRTLGLVAGLALLTAVVDQALKGLVLATLQGKSHALVPGLLYLTYRENHGVAFSALSHLPIGVLIGLNLLVLVLFIWLITPFLRSRAGQAAAVLVLGGALGNLYDRVTRQYVIDYLDFRVWPVFNLADACVVLGVGVLVVLLLRGDRPVPTPPGGIAA